MDVSGKISKRLGQLLYNTYLGRYGQKKKDAKGETANAVRNEHKRATHSDQSDWSKE